MLRRRFCLFLGLALASWVMSPVLLPARDIAQLSILQPNYPRAFFFRASESAHNEQRYPTYASWEQNFDRLQGIIGKCLDEECLGRQKRNPEFFMRFKQRHPRQAVLLHFNGNARDPRYQTEKYFAGHWIYRPATMIVQDVPAESGETVIQLQDAGDFRVKTGRYRTSNDDLALFQITAEGKHDWHNSEQVQLIDVNYQQNTIRVKRGCYGTEPRAFTTGESRAAAHQVEGPWGRHNNLMWYYNFSTHCPRNQDGKSCADLLVDDLTEWFGPQGILAAFDGLEFDVLHHQTHGDTDGDGEMDQGVIRDVNQYGIGVIEFVRQLRQRMTDNFIIQADGALGPGGRRSQRAWQLLNGIESEGWPNLNDWEFADWSGGLNRHFFWQANAARPEFNYVNHKWTQPVPGEPGGRSLPDVPFSRHRLALAACQFFDAMTCYSFAPPNDPNGQYGIWDELRCGVDNQLGWLGRPEGPAVRQATQMPDVLQDVGRSPRLHERISGPVDTQLTDQGIRVTSQSDEVDNLRFTIRSLPTAGNDLFVRLKLSAEPRSGYPREMARFAEIGISGGVTSLMTFPPSSIGMRLRGAPSEVPLDRTTGATLQIHPRTIADKTLPTVFVHPPYREEKGYTFWTQDADIPTNGELRFSIGMGQLSPQRSDGVWFRVLAAELQDGQLQDYQPLFEASTNQHQWIPQTVSLRPYGGKRIRLKFVADCGPRDNATTDHAHWGDVRITRAGLPDSRITRPKQYMTWVNDQVFESGFYYRQVHSDVVDLSINVEGSEPVMIQSITAHAHPDAIYRVFQNGIVLANPAREPYTFDLHTASPGRSYRRIQATPRQDTDTNNGQSVGSRVTIGERDALFLVRIK